jgi:hypothetical protein
MKLNLDKHQQQTFDAIFQHPIARHLHRRDVNSMLAALAEVTQEANGNLKAVRNGETLVLRVSRDKTVTAADELMLIRHFLERSKRPAEVTSAASATAAGSGHVLVVIDHREARVYQAELRGTVPVKILPLDPHGYGRNLHYVQDDSNGQRKPERKSFYEAVAKTLQGAAEILIFGSGTGAASAMEQLMAYVRKELPALAERVVGTVTLDTQHATEDQLLAKAREFYEKREPAGSVK